MHKFLDRHDPPREWRIALNYRLLERIKEDLGIDLLDIHNPSALGRLSFDLRQFVDLLYFVCEAQAQQLGVSDEEFGVGLAGDVFDQAFDAFQAEYTDFFPQSQRTILQATLGRMTQSTLQAVTMAVEEIQSEETSSAIQTKIDAQRSSMRGNIATALKA